MKTAAHQTADSAGQGFAHFYFLSL